MSLTWVFLLMFFIAPQAFAQFTLTATVVDGGIDLSWDGISGAAGYDLYYCEDTTTACTVPTSGGSNPPYLGWITSGTTYQHRNLTAGTTYRYQVTHYVGGTVRSNVASAITPGPSLTASDITTTGATLTLTNHTGNWHYQQTAPTSGSCSSAQTGASASLTGLTAGTAYTYKAYSDSGCTTELASVAFTALPHAGPTGVSASATSGGIELSWSAPAAGSFDGYNVYRCSGASCDPTTWYANPVPASATAYTDTGVTASTVYRYRINAYSDTGGVPVSAFSAVVEATAVALAVPALAASSITQTGATLTLTNHTGNWHYQQTAPTSGSCSSAQTGASASLTGLTAGTAYTYKAYSDSGCTTELASVAFTALPHAGPTGVSASATSGGIELSWSAPAAGSFDGYNVYRCSGASCDPTTWYANPVPASATAYTDTGVTASTVYRYRINAYSDTGGVPVSAFSAVVEATAVALAVPALAASSTTQTGATLTLTNHTGNWHYQQTAPTSGSCSSAQTGASASLTGLTAGTAYTYKAYSDSNCATELASATFTTDSVPVSDLTLRVTASSASAITLSWTNLSTVTSGYDVYRCTVESQCAANPPAGANAVYLSWVPKPGGNTITLVDDDGTESGGRPSPINPGTTYYYAVQGYTSGGDTGFSRVMATAGALPPPPPPPPPSKPVGLIVTSAGTEAISLRWKPSSGSNDGAGYGVYRCTVPEGESTCEPYDDLWLAYLDNSNTYTDTEVTPGETYRYQVAADNLQRENLSRAVTVVAQNVSDSVAPPTGLTVTETTSYVVRLSWTAPEDDGRGAIQAIDIYRCNVDRSPDCSDFLHLASWNPTLTEFRDNEVEPETTYRYALASYRSAKEVSPWSNQVTATTKRGRYASPTDLTVTATFRDAISLSWTAPADGILGYNIYRCLVPAGESSCNPEWHAWVSNPGDAPPAPTSYTDTGGETGKIIRNLAYLYVVSASYPPNYRTGDRSEAVTATARGGRAPREETPMFPPAPATGLTAVSGESGIDLNWTAPSNDIVGYSIYRCEESETPCAPEWVAWVANEGDAPPAPTSYTDTDVAEGTTYRYAVTSNNVDSDGEYHESEWSDEVTVLAEGGGETEPETLPSPPTGFMAVSGESGIDLSWTAPSDDIVGYSIYRCEEGETPCTPEWLAWVASEGDAPPAPTGYMDTDVTEGATYRYAVTSNDSDYDESDWSDEVTVVAREGSPGAPTNLTAVPGDGQITLTWTPPAGTVTGWELLVRTDTDTGSWMSITPSGTTTISYTVTGLTNGVQYTFLVRAVNGMLKGAPAGHRGPATVPSFNAGEFEASFESGGQWFRRGVIPKLSGNTTWNSIAWKGERIQQHILVNNVPSNSRISLVPSDLTNAENHTIPSSAVSFRYPRFVAGHTEARSCSKDYQEENTTAYLSDALFSEPTQALPPSWPELVWMSVDIPSDTPAGEYSGTVSVRAVSATAVDSTELHFSIQVAPWTMPDDAERQFHLDLWQFPVSVLDRYNDANPGDRIEIWSEDHYALLEPTYRYLAGLGQRTVTTYIKEGALGAPSMIQWTLKSDSTWVYDYSVFDDYVSRAAAWGLDQQVSAFSPVGWNEGDIPYWDEANQRKETFSAEVGSSAWAERWRHFLADFREHLLEKGWLDKTVLYLDELSDEQVQVVLDLVHGIDAGWKVGLAYVGYERDGSVLSRLYDSSGSMVRVGTTYVDTGLVPGETYRYAVDGCNDDCSAPSSPVTMVAQTPALPGEPTGLTAGTSATGVTLNWAAPALTGSSALTGYNVYRCVDESGSCAPVWFGRVESGVTSYADSELAVNTAYRYTVEACNGSGCGDKSGEIAVMTGDVVDRPPARVCSGPGCDDGSGGITDSAAERNQAAPTTPTGLTAFAASPTAVQLSWEGQATNGYDIYRCMGSETCEPVAYLGWTYADKPVEHADKISTFYTSCAQPRPNSFVAAAADPRDVEALPWHALERRLDGYLRWAFDNWRSSDPLDVREGAFTAGDFSLVYRSGNDKGMTVVPSIRSEALREGIEDFEKVQVLRDSLSDCAADELAGRWLERLERTVDAFSSTPLMAGRAGDLVGEAHDRLGEISAQLMPDVCR